jgi:ABC-2 type transport system permease protein
MNVFFRELKSYRKSTAIWAVALSAIAFMFLMMFPSFTTDIEVAKKALSAIPEVLRNIANLSLSNFFTIFGFFGYVLTPVTLAGSIQAMSLGVNIISKEESGKTADFLFSKPISRFKILSGKILAGIILIILTNIVFCTVSTVVASAVSENSFELDKFILVCATLCLVQLIFLSIGYGLSAVLPKIKSSVSVALPTVFSFFIVGSLGAIIGDEIARDLSPLKYFTADYIIKNNSYEIKYLLIGGLIFFVMTLISYFVFIKKDIKSGV